MNLGEGQHAIVNTFNGLHGRGVTLIKYISEYPEADAVKERLTRVEISFSGDIPIDLQERLISACDALDFSIELKRELSDWLNGKEADL